VCPHRRPSVTLAHATASMLSDRRIRVKFSRSVPNSFLCHRSKGKGAARAARAPNTYPVLSAKRRHQIHDVDHRDGGAEHLWQQRQFPHAVSIMIGNGRTAPTCQSGLAGRMGEWCTRRAHSMDCSHGTGPWHVPVGAEDKILVLRYALLVEDRPKVGGAGRYRASTEV
jgi:hypothetical protein